VFGGLLLSALWAGDIDRLLHGRAMRLQQALSSNGAAARRSAAQCHEHITNSVIGVSRPPVLDCGMTFNLDYGGRDLPFDSFRQSLKTRLFGDRSA